jgi:hypothetical protein
VRFPLGQLDTTNYRTSGVAMEGGA